ncbi:MAG: SsrA-binding protein SmpB [Bacilli bacterium]|nr:SsrA-binding protein SmpB [Bacilli bacterium]
MIEIKNKIAYHDYFILEEIEAGIELVGTEIKSIRNGNANLKDSYIVIKNNEAYLLNAFIDEYLEGNQFNHDPRRTRKLLLHKKEIIKLKEEREKDGLTIIPIKIYFKGTKAKVLVGLAKGKKLYDKRESIKERDLMRDSKKNMPNY